jgi:Rod binding domain-containing protein
MTGSASGVSSSAATSSIHDVPANASVGTGKLSSAAQEFESVLLGQWLQNAESSFGSVPGGDDDADSCGEQMQGFATQRLAGQLAASGGIGIARLVEQALRKAAERESSGSANVSPSTSAEGRDAAQSILRAQSASSAGQAYSVEAEHEQ